MSFSCYNYKNLVYFMKTIKLSLSLILIFILIAVIIIGLLVFIAIKVGFASDAGLLFSPSSSKSLTSSSGGQNPDIQTFPPSSRYYSDPCARCRAQFFVDWNNCASIYDACLAGCGLPPEDPYYHPEEQRNYDRCVNACSNAEIGCFSLAHHTEDACLSRNNCNGNS